MSKGYGRLEQHTLTVSSQLQDFLDWPYLQQVFKLERKFTFLKTGKVQQQIVYGFTSLSREKIAPSNCSASSAPIGVLRMACIAAEMSRCVKTQPV